MFNGNSKDKHITDILSSQRCTNHLGLDLLTNNIETYDVSSLSSSLFDVSKIYFQHI